MMWIAVISAYYWAWPVLAESSTSPLSDLVSLTALGNFLKVILLAVAVVAGKIWGNKQRVALEEPIPEVPTRQRKGAYPPTWDQHAALIDRVLVVERDIRELRADQGNQYKDLIEAGQERESRLSDKLDGIARGIHTRIDELFKPSKPTR